MEKREAVIKSVVHTTRSGQLRILQVFPSFVFVQQKGIVKERTVEIRNQPATWT
jgi:hypothetical protein